MNKLVTSAVFVLFSLFAQGQLSPAITSWLQNTTETGSYYVQGNSTAIDNGVLYNCQKVEYSNDYVYVSTHGIPAYPTGPFLDGNPSQAESQDAIFRITLNPEENTGDPVATTPGNIGIFINGVALFDYRDGVAWDSQNNRLCGGPGNPRCSGPPGTEYDWNRDAIPAERAGFDCSKAHPAMGNYHHHQNPSAFKLDLEVISDICDLYDADGLYAIDETEHSPLIGYAYDGFPIYGAYGYKNPDGSGGITRIKSGYQLRNITERTHHADGTDVDDGPNTDDYFLGYFREDYEWIEHPEEEDYLDVHNGRFCVTPEYPDGIYAYFATVDENWNSAYPYVVGPNFYGVAVNASVESIDEPTTVYDGTVTSISETEFNTLDITVFPNPTADLIAVQINDLAKEDFEIELFDLSGKMVSRSKIRKGSTISYIDTETIYGGIYWVKISSGEHSSSKKVVIAK